jgi:5,10-methenyltetrahydrofolate synthetase
MLILPPEYGKDDIRKLCKNIRDNLPNRDSLSESLWTHLYSIREYKLCKSILVYASIGSEPDTLPLMHRALQDGKNVYCPVVSGHDMQFYRVDSPTDLVPSGRYAIPEPPVNPKKIYKASKTPAICIVPALCVDKKGYRIGYGGGYYDRYFRKETVGIDKIFLISAIFSALCKEYFPHDEFDVPIDMIITEEKITRIGGER